MSRAAAAAPGAVASMAAALQLEALSASSLGVARAAIRPALQLARRRGARLAVLPAYLGLSLIPAFARPAPRTWPELALLLPSLASSLGPAWATLSAELARESNLLLLAGTTLVVDSSRQLRQRAYLFGPDGAPLGWQDQTHPSARERALGVVPADTLEAIDTPYGRVGIIIGDDVLVPEVGGILALQDASILLHPTATPALQRPEWQRRLWREAQAHQLFGVESPLVGSLLGEDFAGLATIHAPVELTRAQQGRPHGVLAQSAQQAGEAVTLASLEEHERRLLLQRSSVAALRNRSFCRAAFLW